MNERGKDKSKVLARARREGRKVLWRNAEGVWHAATNWRNTPFWASEAEGVDGYNVWQKEYEEQRDAYKANASTSALPPRPPRSRSLRGVPSIPAPQPLQKSSRPARRK